MIRPAEDDHILLTRGAADMGFVASSPAPEGVRYEPVSVGSDGLDAGAWVGLLPERAAAGTRRGDRSIDQEEQARVLVVGACLGCHPSADDPVYRDFDLGRAEPQCAGPHPR